MRALCILLATLHLAAAAGPALAGAQAPATNTVTATPAPPESPGDPSRELLVLLDRTRAAAKPEDVVDMVRRGQPLPASLGLGTPVHARWLIPEPDRSTYRSLDPDSPAGLLNRYIVLSYPPPIDRAALLQSMRHNR